jgi:hypothetical protein
MPNAWIIWDTEHKQAIPGCFPSSAEAQTHADDLSKKELRSGKASTKTVVGPVTI